MNRTLIDLRALVDSVEVGAKNIEYLQTISPPLSITTIH
jgi:hypothetical protein